MSTNNMNPLSLTPIKPDNLILYANPSDVRRDLHTYVNYVNGRNIKRSYRGNELPQSDYKRLSQLMNIHEPTDKSDHESDTNWYAVGSHSWVDYIDWLAHRMGFVSYDTEGTYRGYSSTEPSFQDNFIGFNAEVYRKFLTLPIADQERELFDTLINDWDYTHNEFYEYGVVGRLDRFPTWGAGIGMMPSLNFTDIRRFLFDILQDCQPGIWYSTASLTAYLKANHRYFLIPEKLGTEKPAKILRQLYDSTPPKRYGNFYEEYNFNRDSVPSDAPDGFERVEGRYIERFLENIPLTLGYVEVAYDPVKPDDKKLSRGILKAFRINERFLQAIHGDIPQPRVTIQANFEIYVESVFYPAYLLSRLTPLADVIRQDTTTILKLQKQKVAAQLAENEGLDVVNLLKNLSEKELPQNVLVGLQEWASHADVFTLYDGFGLVESADKHHDLDAFTVVEIGESMRLVHDPAELFAQLRDSGTVAIHIQHMAQNLLPLPDKAHTVFPKKVTLAPTQKKKTRQAVTVKRETLVALYLPDDDLFEKFRKALIELRCTFEANKEKRTLTLPGQQDAQLKQVIKRLSDDYAIQLEDVV